jgi:hypothetical protein
MTITSRLAGSVSEQGAPPSVGSSMPPELACEMARAGELLDLGDRVGARRIVRRVLYRAALELLAELAGLATDLGLGAEDLGAAAVRRALRWVPPTRVRRRPFPASGLCRVGGPAQHRAAGHAVRAARPGGVATGAARCRPTWPPAGVSTTPRSRAGAPTVTPSTSTAPPWSARRRWCARVATWSAPRPTSSAATGCARTAGPTGSAVTRWWCGARPSWPRRCARTVGPPRAAAAVERRRRRRPGDRHRLGRRPRRPHPPGPARPLTRASRARGPVNRR